MTNFIGKEHIKTLIFAIFSAAALVSCVSTGVYEEALKKNDSLALANDSLEKVVYANNVNIDDLQAQLEDKKAQVENLQSQLKLLNENYDELKKNSSSDAKQFIATLEKLRADLAEKNKRIDDIESKLKAREEKMNALRETLTSALKAFEERGLQVSMKNGYVYVSLSNQLLFAAGKTDVDDEGKKALLELAEALKQQPDIKVLVEGHTDVQTVRQNPRFQDNWDLSVLRATEVVRFLTEEGGIEPGRVTASGRGEFFPIAKGEDPDSLAVNRRTEIILSPKIEEALEILKK